MEFKLMRINFSAEGQRAGIVKPFFEDLRTFLSAGSVMNVFLLDPAQRLLATFMWMDTTRTIGLFVLSDWDRDEYVFVDTGLKCVCIPLLTMRPIHAYHDAAQSLYGIWSCILNGDDIVIHSEAGAAAHQHMYSLQILKKYAARFQPGKAPQATGELRPPRSMTRPFVFPRLPDTSVVPAFPAPVIGGQATNQAAAFNLISPPLPITLPPDAPGPVPDPFPPPWFPEGANFVRQWWPTLPGVPRVSCSAVLYALHDHISTRTKYVLSQHYFSVPLCAPPPGPPPGTDMLMRKFFVSAPFELVCVADAFEGADDDAPRPRPLLAVDFGFAAWIEYQDEPAVSETMRMRCVAFPSVRVEGEGVLRATGLEGLPVAEPNPMEGCVRTLEVPAELELKKVESVNIDQSQGAVIVSVLDGKIFVLYYE
jgi:hypothetical protein